MTAQPIWDEAVGRLKARVSPQNYDMWLRPIELMSFDGAILRLRAPNSYVRLWFESNYLDSLHREFAELGHQIRVEFAPELEERPTASGTGPVDTPSFATGTQPDPAPTPEAVATAPAPRPSTLSANVDEIVAPEAASLNPRYTFDTFVAGPSNQLAFAASQAAASSYPPKYNPVFICGGVGLGKTHLLHAIGHYAESLYPGIRVRYVSSEEFTNDFINSIANNRASVFQSRYREIDILLIDDIQFLQGKDSTQEAFFHTFNTLHDHNKQVVITSDVAPKHLTGFEDRMRSRFEWGLITDVQAPDLETRIAILRKKAQSERLQVPDDILEYMATKVSSNIRELEGTLIRVTAFANLNKTPVDLALVQTVLKDLITLDEDNVISPVDIINHTADYFKLSVDDLYGSSRSQAVATARQIAMYLCREMTNLSLPKIGQLFGNRDHTTVMYANKKISELMKERRSIYNQVTELTARIKQDQRYRP